MAQPNLAADRPCPVSADATMIAGTRRFSAANHDCDTRVTRLLPNDTIFADLFGGVASD